jgi:hypothetical protein
MKGRLALLTVGALLGLTAATAQAAPPVNDGYASAVTITSSPLPQQVSGTNVSATLEASEPDPTGLGDGIGASVWYSWTAPATQPVQFHTCNGPALDTVVAVYTAAGAVPPFTNLDLEGEDDQGCGTDNSNVEVAVIMGTAYKIQVSGFDLDGVGGNPAAEGAFALRIAARPPPAVFDSGPGTTDSAYPSFSFHADVPASLFGCTIFTHYGGVLIFSGNCSSPFTAPLPLAVGVYDLFVGYRTTTGETTLFDADGAPRTFTIVPPSAAPPAAAPSATTPKKCKKGRKLKRGKCVKKKKK